LAAIVSSAAKYAPLVNQAVSASRQVASNVSVELVGYDFIGLLVKVVFFQLVALLIAKYIEVVNGASNIVVSIAKFFGYNVPMFLPQSVVDFYVNGWNGIKYWDVVKFATIAIIAIELNNYVQAQKKLGGQPSAATVGVFLLLIGFFFIITVPELVQRLKDANAMSTAPATTGITSGGI